MCDILRFAITKQTPVHLNKVPKVFAAQIATLQSVTSDAHQVTIVNVHLEGDPNAEHIRSLQMEQVLQQVAVATEQPILVAGDCNSSAQQAVYVHMTLQQHFTSAMYENGEPEFTYYTPEQKATMDFVFAKQLQVQQKSVMVSKSYLPNAEIPSDHLALFATFKWIVKKL